MRGERVRALGAVRGNGSHSRNLEGETDLVVLVDSGVLLQRRLHVALDLGLGVGKVRERPRERERPEREREKGQRERESGQIRRVGMNVEVARYAS